MVTFDDSVADLDGAADHQQPPQPHVADIVGDMARRSTNFSKYRSGRSYIQNASDNSSAANTAAAAAGPKSKGSEEPSSDAASNTPSVHKAQRRWRAVGNSLSFLHRSRSTTVRKVGLYDFGFTMFEPAFHEKYEQTPHKMYGTTWTNRKNKEGLLGAGSFGVVRRVRMRSNGLNLAVKAIPKKKLKGYEHELEQEVQTWSYLAGSLNAITLYETFEDKDNVYLVMEVCNGGDLYHRMKSEHYTEAEACYYVYSVLRSLAHLHAKNVIHRDIKPGNFLFLDKSKTSHLKICDFGFAVHAKPFERLTEVCGTPLYMAPEVIKGWYDSRCDVWSAGVLAFEILAGRILWLPKPSEKLGTELLFKRILREDCVQFISRYHGKTWSKLSSGARDLVLKLLERDPRKRITLQDALSHTWFTTQFTDTSSLPFQLQFVARAQEFSIHTAVKQLVLYMIASKIVRAYRRIIESKEDILKANGKSGGVQTDTNNNPTGTRNRLSLRRRPSLSYAAFADLGVQSYSSTGETSQVMRKKDNLFVAQEAGVFDQLYRILKAFEAIDINRTGSIDLSNCLVHIEKSKLAITESDFYKIFDRIDVDRSGSLSLIEFTGVMLESHLIMEKAPQLWKQLLLECFRDLDVDKTNKIDADNLREALAAIDSRALAQDGYSQSERSDDMTNGASGHGSYRDGAQMLHAGSTHLPRESSVESFSSAVVATNLETEIRLAIEDGDTTGDGRIDWNGFQRMMEPELQLNAFDAHIPTTGPFSSLQQRFTSQHPNRKKGKEVGRNRVDESTAMAPGCGVPGCIVS